MKTIIITGASSGIGRATVEVFLKDGWHVGLLARRRGPLEDLAGLGPTTVLQADVTQEDQVAAAFSDFMKTNGRLDALFNNAGMFGPSAPIDEVSFDAWSQVVSTNISGMFLCAREAFRAMRAQSPQGGRIINNGSLSAYVPREGSVCYTTSKHAITGLTRTLSLDGRPFDIACGQLDIGNARTEMVADLGKRMSAENPDGPPPQTMDVAHAANAVLHMANLPAEANVQFMTVMATKMPFIGRG
jgi:NAD(P)-dependent dehydrogenase (short-subunit alcohol dehydrogenase family)